MERKKVLIITYYWPPAGGPGVQRWLKMSKYLRDLNWEPIIFTPENPDFQVTDHSLLKDFPKDIKVIKHPIWEPYSFFRKLTRKGKADKVNSGLLFSNKKKSLLTRIALWLRGNILIPDPRRFWVSPSVKRLSKKFASIKPDVIITTGPPHSIHLIGQKLHKKHNTPWVSDFRDPWSNLDILDIFSPSKYAQNKQIRLEKAVLENSTLSIAVSKSWEKELINLGAKNTITITNGFDTSDFNDYTPTSPEKFIISYGGIITSFRNPSLFWEALNELCIEDNNFYDDLKINLTGTIDAQVKASIQSFEKVHKKTSYTDYLPHHKLIKQYGESACLLLLLNNTDNSKGHIPGKFFEYLACRKPIFAIGNSGGDVAKILNETNHGTISDFNDKTLMKNNILEIYASFKDNEDFCSNNINNYSRKELTHSLVQQLNLLVP